MRHWLIVALFAVACASPAPSGAQRPEIAEEWGGPVYADARDRATEEQIRDARRAYRAACQTRNSHGWCECMTGGMAQVLHPDDLAIATADFSGQPVQAPQAARDRVAAGRSEVERGCEQFRG
jgi:hypothetical protein